MWIIAKPEREDTEILLNLNDFYKAIPDPDNKNQTRLVQNQTVHLNIQMKIQDLWIMIDKYQGVTPSRTP